MALLWYRLLVTNLFIFHVNATTTTNPGTTTTRSGGGTTTTRNSVTTTHWWVYSPYEYFDTDLICVPYQDCSLNCRAGSACDYATIYGPLNAELTINCNTESSDSHADNEQGTSCLRLTVHAENSTKLYINVWNENGELADTDIYIPTNPALPVPNTFITCGIVGYHNLNQQPTDNIPSYLPDVCGSADHHNIVYSKNGFESVLWTYDNQSVWALSTENTMRCGSNYQYSCSPLSIQADQTLNCADTQSPCYSGDETKSPTDQPTTTQPTISTMQPSNQPSIPPSSTPTKATSQPTNMPSVTPTSAPTQPTRYPTNQPSIPPTSAPTQATNSPSEQPTTQPTSSPTRCTENEDVFTNDGFAETNLTLVITNLTFVNPVTDVSKQDIVSDAAGKHQERIVMKDDVTQELQCINVVSCYESPQISFTNNAICNLMCSDTLACASSTIDISNCDEVHIICNGDDACAITDINITNTRNTVIDCGVKSSCAGLVVSITGATSHAQISCYEANSCDDIVIFVEDYENSVLAMHSHSVNVKFDNGVGFRDLDNNEYVQCNTENRYIPYETTLNDEQINDLVLNEYQNDAFPCDGVLVGCLYDLDTVPKEGTCQMSYTKKHSISVPSTPSDCYWTRVSDIIQITCHGDCVGSPTAPPTPAPTRNPTAVTVNPTSDPTVDPTIDPTNHPTNVPSNDPTNVPTSNPTIDPTHDPTMDPTSKPTHYPTSDPTVEPTSNPTIDPTSDPTIDPTDDPTIDPTIDPTNDPTQDPTADPTHDPTMDPTSKPTHYPTSDPTVEPTSNPTVDPTRDPTIDPTHDPTNDPSNDPTRDPTSDPTYDPTNDPTTDPTKEPTGDPSAAPSISPTISPSAVPSESPTNNPSNAPSHAPSLAPTLAPSFSPSDSPSNAPTRSPTADNDWEMRVPITYMIKFLTDHNLELLEGNTLSYTPRIAGYVEQGYFKEVVAEYQDFEVTIDQINDFDDLSQVYLSSGESVELHSNVFAARHVVHFLLQTSKNGEEFEKQVSANLKQLFTDNDDLVFSVREPGALEAEETKSDTSDELPSIVIFSIFALACGSLLSLLLLYINRMKGTKVDNVNAIAPFLYSLQVYDAISDAFLCNDIGNHMVDDITTACFIGAIVFTVYPFLSNLYYGVTITNQDVIRRNKRANEYFTANIALLIGLIVISGGCYNALLVVSCGMFGLNKFSSGLTQHELNALTKIKIRSTIWFENAPQIVIQIVYTIARGGDINDAVVFAFIGSMLSVVMTLASYYAQKNVNKDANVMSYYLRFDTGVGKLSSDQVKKIENTKGRTKELTAAMVKALNISEENIQIGYVWILNNGLELSVSHFLTKAELAKHTRNIHGFKTEITPAEYIHKLYAQKKVKEAMDQVFRAHSGIADTDFHVTFVVDPNAPGASASSAELLSSSSIGMSDTATAGVEMQRMQTMIEQMFALQRTRTPDDDDKQEGVALLHGDGSGAADLDTLWAEFRSLKKEVVWNQEEVMKNNESMKRTQEEVMKMLSTIEASGTLQNNKSRSNSKSHAL
eukprot:1116856_1